jgi:hypothetical protein
MPADDPVFAAFQRLRDIAAGDPQNAAAWAKDAALLARTEPELLEAALPIGHFRGFWPEVIRCCLAIGAGRKPPPPRDWRLPDSKPRRKVTAKSPATQQKKAGPGRVKS